MGFQQLTAMIIHCDTIGGLKEFFFKNHTMVPGTGPFLEFLNRFGEEKLSIVDHVWC